jgi:hypothetical protein
MGTAYRDPCLHLIWLVRLVPGRRCSRLGSNFGGRGRSFLGTSFFGRSLLGLGFALGGGFLGGLLLGIFFLFGGAPGLSLVRGIVGCAWRYKGTKGKTTLSTKHVVAQCDIHRFPPFFLSAIGRSVRIGGFMRWMGLIDGLMWEGDDEEEERKEKYKKRFGI